MRNRKRTSPRRAKGITLGPAARLGYLGLIVVLIVGSTGCESKPEPSYPPPAPQQPAATPPVQPESGPTGATPAATPPSTDTVPDGITGDPAANPAIEPQPTPDAAKPEEKIPPRPENLADWKKDDFVNAKKENDPRLIEAINHLGANRVGDPEVAEMVAAALRFIKPEERPAEPSGTTSTPPPSDNMLLDGPVTGIAGSGPSGPRQPAQLDARTIAAAIKALSANNTDPARAVLRTIVTGELTTDDDRTATLSAMRALLEDPAAENEAFMLRVLTEPAEVRKPAGSGAVADPGAAQMGAGMAGYGMGTSPPLTAETLYEEAKQRVDRFASESFRLKLVQYLLTSSRATVKQKEELGVMLQRPNPENVAPQLLIYQAPLDAAELKAAMEKFFTEVSSVALGHMLGILEDKEPEVEVRETTTKPSEGGGWRVGGPGTDLEGFGPQPHEPMGLDDPSGLGGGLEDPSSMEARAANFHNPKVIYPLAQKLWNPKTAQTVTQRIAQVTALDPGNSTLALARTIPVDQVRAGLYALLLAHHEDGPGQLIGDAGTFGAGYGGPGLMGGFDDGLSTPGTRFGHGGGGAIGETGVIFDPGFLVVVKMLPREDKRAPKTAKRSRTARTPAAGGLSPDPGADMLHGGAQVEADTPAKKWMDASENLLKLLCQQCERAAEGQNASGDKPSEKMPIKPHPKANITARFEMKWPDDAAAKLGETTLDPIEVHFVRIEDTTQFSRLTKYYQRAAKTKPRTIGQSDAWFDSIDDSETPGRTLSCDVLVTRPQGAAPAPAGMVRGRRVEPEEPLVVHILTIEMNDPTGGKPKAETPASEP
ncbi:MAG: hypothetical protein GX621_14525 [Pirellulaceae bacterium]|nr:hypothetical protein [Pirellulaceae bacterium]